MADFQLEKMKRFVAAPSGRWLVQERTFQQSVGDWIDMIPNPVAYATVKQLNYMNSIMDKYRIR